MYTIPAPTIVSINLIDGKLEIISRRRSIGVTLEYPPRPQSDEIWKDIYESIDGKIELVKTIQGTHIPAEIIPEQFKFEDDG